MNHLLRILCTIFLLSVTNFGWTACPVGQKENDRTGKCTLISSQTGSNESKTTDASSSHNQQSLSAEQTGYISFSSPPFMGLKQFLEGGPVGPPIKVRGYLAFPSSGVDRMPAVILLHGGKGISHQCRGDRDCSIYKWAEKMQHIGLATFVIDSNEIRCRGREKCYNLNQGLPNIIDAFRAMALLSTHPRIDPTRIALMGFSVGGIATLYATVKRFQRMWAPEGQEPAAYVSFYPACNYTWSEGDLVTDRPVRILMGDKDQTGYYVPCVDYVNRLRKAGKDFKITIYPGIHHGFDNDLKRGSKWSIGPHPTYCLWQEEKGIGMVQVAEESDAFYAGCSSLLPDRLRECRHASMSDQMRPQLDSVLQLRASQKRGEQAQTVSDSSTSTQTSSSVPVDPQLDEAFAEFVAQYVSQFWQGWDPGKKIGDCLARNAAAMTIGAKKGVMEYGLDDAFEKLSDSDMTSFDEVYALCEKGGPQEQVKVQFESALDKAFAKFVTGYISENWGSWGPGKKMGQCLGENSESITEQAKKDVIQFGLEEAFEKLSGSDLDSLGGIYASCQAAYQDEGDQAAKSEYARALDGFERAMVESAKYFEGQELLMSDISCEVAKSRNKYDQKTHHKAIKEVAEFFRTTFNL